MNKMQKTLDTLKADLGKIRTGRATTAMLDSVKIDYYGTPKPVSQVASVILIDGRTLGVTPWDKKMIKSIEKAIRDNGLNPSTIGEMVRVPMPVITEERRKELVKQVKQQGEVARIAIRNIRREENNNLGMFPEDEKRKLQNAIQKETDQHIAEIDSLLKKKEAELLCVS